MSRRVRLPVRVACNGLGEPVALLSERFRGRLPVLARLRRWREWIGALDGEPERDVWQVETPQGICELHCVRFPAGDAPDAGEGEWLLVRWED